MKRLLLITLAALLGALSCQKTGKPSGSGEGLRVVLGSGSVSVSTRAAMTLEEQIADGSAIYLDSNGNPDLVILITDDATGEIVRRYPGPRAELVEGNTATDMAVVFEGLSHTGGDKEYTVYAFGNTEGMWDMVYTTPERDTIDVAHDQLTSLTSTAQLEKLMFKPHYDHSDITNPGHDHSKHDLEIKNGRMPLSARGVALVSESGNGEVGLEMLRCVAKVSLEFKNETADTLDLSNASFSIENICPDRGCVMIHNDHVMPVGTQVGHLVHSDAVATFYPWESMTFDFYVHPCISPTGRFLLNVQLTYEGNDEDDEVFEDLPIGNDHAVDMGTLDRNEHMHILCVITVGHTVSFNFEVSDWEEHEERVTFD